MGTRSGGGSGSSSLAHRQDLDMPIFKVDRRDAPKLQMLGRVKSNSNPVPKGNEKSNGSGKKSIANSGQQAWEIRTSSSSDEAATGDLRRYQAKQCEKVRADEAFVRRTTNNMLQTGFIVYGDEAHAKAVHKRVKRLPTFKGTPFADSTLHKKK